jgi:hypothetical protein
MEDEGNIDRFYENLTLSANDNPLINRILVQRFQKEQNLKKLVSCFITKRLLLKYRIKGRI